MGRRVPVPSPGAGGTAALRSLSSCAFIVGLLLCLEELYPSDAARKRPSGRVSTPTICHAEPMPGLTSHELHTFLDEPGHLLRLGTIGTDGIPRVVPIWFIARDGAVWFTPRARSAWLADLRASSAVCVTIDESTHPMRKLVARGRAELVHDLGEDDEWRDLYRSIACRYTPERFADAYLADTIDEARALWRLVLADCEVATWRMPLAERGEDPLAVWSSKYYHRSV
jgi:nitroimidazol reductase NimA-like FMN-containing flavoprotein (pyridoxamine 5'-phosphate oxidase superfamily)